MLTEEFHKLLIEEPYPELKERVSYGDFVEIDHKTTPINDIEDIREVLEDQCEDSLLKIRQMRGEQPVAIWFFINPHPEKRECSIFGWQSWMSKRKK